MSLNKKTVTFLFIFIVVVASVLRLWQLGSIPPAPDWDEVALGYDAYSILHTGRDEYGKFLPIVLRSFDDYKPAMYAYLSIPTVFIFGLNTFAVRLPSAIFGIISVIAVFFLLREIFGNSKFRDPLALMASTVLAISPWSLQFSRVGFESNVADAFNILMALFFVKGLKKPLFLPLAAVMGAFSIYTYQSDKVFTPLLALLLIAIFWKKLWEVNKKYLTFALLSGFLVILPMVFYIATDKSSLLRLKGTSIFSYQTDLLQNNIPKLVRDNANNDLLGKVLDNRRIVYAKEVVFGYVSHFDPNWLFITGDIARHHAPNVGLIYLVELPFIIFGIYKLLFGDFDKKTKLLIFGWFLLAPIPASITTGVPHAVRTLNFLPIWQIFSAVGLVYTIIYVNKFKKTKYLFYFTFSFIFLFNFVFYLNQYFVQLNYFDSQQWQYGYAQAIGASRSLIDKYDKVVVSDTQPMDKSYMFFLFYLKTPPQDYQKVGIHSSGGYAAHHSFGKFTFRPIDWDKDSQSKNTLFIGPPSEIPNSAAIDSVNNLDGTTAIRIAKT